MQKVDAIVEANPGVSLDDLVASRKINNDQRASALKKPHLQAQLAQLEEQLAQYKKFDQEYQQKIAQEKEILQRSHSEELERLRDTLKAESVLEAKKVFRENTLTLSRFLRAAAARRQLEEEVETDLTKAYEGALCLVYGGDASAVDTVEKLIEGSDDRVLSMEREPLSVTCKLEK
jgi:ribosomal protein L16 Arg81 hydroxylase